MQSLTCLLCQIALIKDHSILGLDAMSFGKQDIMKMDAAGASER